MKQTPMQRLMVAGIIVMVVAYLYLLQAQNATEDPTPPPQKPGNGGFEIVKSKTGNRILLEAEATQEVVAPMKIQESGGKVLEKASKTKCLYLGPEKVNESAEIKQLEKGHPEADYPGYSRYALTVPASDDYTLWVRAFWVDQCGNSVAISVNGSRPSVLESSTYGRWTWNQLKVSGGQAARIHLEKDKKNTLTLCNREDDLYIDQILLLGSDRTWPEPTGQEKK